MKNNFFYFFLIIIFARISTPAYPMDLPTKLSNLKTKLNDLKSNLTNLKNSLRQLKTKLQEPAQPQTLSKEQVLAILQAPTCAVPGCNLACWRDPRAGEWYSPGHGITHRNIAEAQGLKPICVVCKYLKLVDQGFCHPVGNVFSPTCGQTHYRLLQTLRENLSQQQPQQPLQKPKSLQKISPATIQAMKQKPSATIYFYEKNQPYYEFTNFWDQHPMMIDGRLWPTTEHYFQAQKFIGAYQYLQDKIRDLATPRDVFIAANGVTGTYKDQIRKDWNTVSLDVMRKAIHEKFSQHPDLAAVLKSTGTSTLVEHTTKDKFWGDGGDGSGQNWLGKILMEARATL